MVLLESGRLVSVTHARHIGVAWAYWDEDNKYWVECNSFTRGAVDIDEL
jgi:hypothetical protein